MCVLQVLPYFMFYRGAEGKLPYLQQLLADWPAPHLSAVSYGLLGLQVLPYFMFYRGAEGKLEEFSASSKRLHLIQ